MYTGMFFVLLLALLIVVVVITAYLLRDKTDSDVETIVEYDGADFGGDANFTLTSLPDSEILTPQHYRLINGITGEIIYLAAPSCEVRLRAAPKGKLLIPDAYSSYSYEAVVQYPISEYTVTHRQSAGRRAMLTWERDGFSYALLSPEPEMNLMGGIIEDFVNLTKGKIQLK